MPLYGSSLDSLLEGDSPVAQVAQDSVANPAYPWETPDDTNARQLSASTAEARQQARDAAQESRNAVQKNRVNIVKGRDLAARKIPSYTDSLTGEVQPVTDPTGTPLNFFDKKNQIAYDSAGAPKKIVNEDPDAPPSLVDPFEGVPVTTDEKTGNQYKITPGLPWQYVGSDADVKRKNDIIAFDKTAAKIAAVQGQKLTLDQRQSLLLKKQAQGLKQHLDGLGIPTEDEEGNALAPEQMEKAINDSFDEQKKIGVASKTTGWFGSGAPSPEALTAQQQIEQGRQKTLQAAQRYHAVRSSITEREAQLEAQRQAQDDLLQSRLAAQQELLTGEPAQGSVSLPVGAQGAGAIQSRANSGSTPQPASIPGLDQDVQSRDSEGSVTAGSSPADVGASPPPQGPAPEGVVGSLLRPIATGAIPALGTAVGGLAGAAGAGLLTAPTGPGVIAGAVAGNIAGGAAGAALGQKIQDALMGGDRTKENQAQMEANLRENPIASKIGAFIPAVLTMLGSAGNALKGAGEGILARFLTNTASQPSYLAKALAALPETMTLGARMSAGATGQNIVEGKQSVADILPDAAKGALTMGPVAFIPAAGTLLGSLLGKAPADAAVLATSNALYEKAVHGKDVNFEELAKDIGTDLPGFMLASLFHAYTHSLPLYKKSSVTTPAEPATPPSPATEQTPNQQKGVIEDGKVTNVVPGGPHPTTPGELMQLFTADQEGLVTDQQYGQETDAHDAFANVPKEPAATLESKQYRIPGLNVSDEVTAQPKSAMDIFRDTPQKPPEPEPERIPGLSSMADFLPSSEQLKAKQAQEAQQQVEHQAEQERVSRVMEAAKEVGVQHTGSVEDENGKVRESFYDPVSRQGFTMPQKDAEKSANLRNVTQAKRNQYLPKSHETPAPKPTAPAEAKSETPAAENAIPGLRDERASRTGGTGEHGPAGEAEAPAQAGEEGQGKIPGLGESVAATPEVTKKKNLFDDVQFAPEEDNVHPLLHSTQLESKNPAKLRVAAKTAEGKIVEGKIGEHHFNLEAPEGSEMGFVDETGKYLNRGEAQKVSQTARVEKSPPNEKETKSSASVPRPEGEKDQAPEARAELASERPDRSAKPHTAESVAALPREELSHLGGIVEQKAGPDGPAGTNIDPATLTIERNHETLAKHANTIDAAGGDGKAWLNSVAKEEAHHAANLIVSGEAFNSIHRRIWAGMTPEAKAEIARIYPGSSDPAVLAAEYMARLSMHRNGTELPEKTSKSYDTSKLETELGKKQSPLIERHYEEVETATAPEGKLSAGEPTPDPEPEKRASPHDFVPALRETSGNIIKGRKGDTHSTIKDRQSKEWNFKNLLASLERKDAEHGFVDKEGNFKTREETSEALGEKIPMQSEWLRDMQDGTMNAGVPKPIKDIYDRAAAQVRAFREEMTNSKLKDKLAVNYDWVHNDAEIQKGHARDEINHDFVIPHGKETNGGKRKRTAQQSLDRNAAPFVEESGGDKAKMQEFLNKVKASPDPKLVAKFVPIVEHGMANFDRIDSALEGHREMMKKLFAEAKAGGLDVEQAKDYVTRLVDYKPDEPTPLFPMGTGKGGSGSRYFARGRVFEHLADLISHGLDVKTSDIAQLDAHRAASQARILNHKAIVNEMQSIKTPDSKDLITEPEESAASKQRQFDYMADVADWVAKGKPGDPPREPKREYQVPEGYTSVNVLGQPLLVHKSFSNELKSLYETDSAFRRNAAGRFALKAAAWGKTYTLVFDSFHVGRVLYKMATSGSGANVGKGMGLIEHSDAELDAGVHEGEISKEAADYAKEKRPLFNQLVEHGLNTGKIADNLAEQAHAAIPGMGKMNNWIFNKLTRSAITQTGIRNAERNIESGRFKTEDEAIRAAAKETNELYGNLQSQGIFKSKTLQDMSRLFLLAPQWTEGIFRNEVRSYGQLPGLAKGALHGNLNGGNAARTMAMGFLAMFAANQVINYATRKQPTWDNEEDGHKLDAFIPGGKRGFWFSPMEIAAEYSHAAMKYLARHENPMDIATHIAQNKFSGLARGAKELVTGRDYAGRPFQSAGDRVRSAATDVLPMPMFLNANLEKDARQPLGYRAQRTPGSGEKQILQSAGMKVSNAESPRTQMFALAQPFRADKGKGDSAGEYTQLRQALDNDNMDAAKDEVARLYKGGKSREAVLNAVGIKTGAETSGGVKTELFAGSAAREQEMLRSLTPYQKQVYRQAQKDHAENARKLQRVINSVPGAPKPLPKQRAMNDFYNL